LGYPLSSSWLPKKKGDQLAKRDTFFKEDIFQVRQGVERMAIETWGYLQVGDPGDVH
jgi:hypothetical protein